MTAQHELVVTLFMSMSVNGMIARPHGSEDFLSNINWQAFVDVAKAAGAVAWGRKTHEKFRRVAVADIPGVRGFVLTSNRAFQDESGWQVATSPEETVAMAAQAGVRELLVVGGASVNAAFAQQRLVDRVVLNIESVLIGQGIPLFASGVFDLQLHLREIRTLSPTVRQMHYDVLRPVRL